MIECEMAGRLQKLPAIHTVAYDTARGEESRVCGLLAAAASLQGSKGAGLLCCLPLVTLPILCNTPHHCFLNSCLSTLSA